MSRIRQRTKNLIVAGVVGAIAMGAVSAGGAVYLIKYQVNEKKEMRAQYEAKLAEADNRLQQQQSVLKSVVVTRKALKAGEALTEADLKTIEIPETEAPSNRVVNKKDLLGKVVKIDVGSNTPLIRSMVFDEGPTPRDLRSQEYNVIVLPTKIEKGQSLDVRITFPTGEEFIVLAKQKVRDVSDTTVWFNVSESEMLLMSSAIVDAYLHGAKLSAVTYVDPYIQAQATPNYPANLNVIELIRNNPNVLETAIDTLRRDLRNTLESNLSSSMLQQHNRAVTGAPSPSPTRSTGTTTSSSAITDSSNAVPKDQIVQPSNGAAEKEEQEDNKQDILEQSLVK